MTKFSILALCFAVVAVACGKDSTTPSPDQIRNRAKAVSTCPLPADLELAPQGSIELVSFGGQQGKYVARLIQRYGYFNGVGGLPEVSNYEVFTIINPTVWAELRGTSICTTSSQTDPRPSPGPGSFSIDYETGPIKFEMPTAQLQLTFHLAKGNMKLHDPANSSEPLQFLTNSGVSISSDNVMTTQRYFLMPDQSIVSLRVQESFSEIVITKTYLSKN